MLFQVTRDQPTVKIYGWGNRSAGHPIDVFTGGLSEKPGVVKLSIAIHWIMGTLEAHTVRLMVEEAHHMRLSLTIGEPRFRKADVSQNEPALE